MSNGASTTASTDVDYLVLSVYDSFLEKQMLVVMYVLVWFLGLLGNASVLMAGMFSLQTRSVTSVFILNMATADFLACLVVPIIVLAILTPGPADLLIPHGLCAFQAFLLIVLCGCSINSIALVALYRALITCRGTESRLVSMFKPCGLAIMVAASWILPLSLCLLPVVSEGYGSYGYNANSGMCSFKPSSPGLKTFSMMLTVSFYPVQLVVIVTSYAAIFVRLRKQAMKVQQRPPTVAGEVMGIPLEVRPAPPRHNDQVSRRNLTVTLNMFLVLFLFIVCITPFTVAFPLFQPTSHKLLPFLGCLFVSNSCVNPVIYIARHPDFKKVCRCILLCRLSQIPRKSPLLRRLLSLHSG